MRRATKRRRGLLLASIVALGCASGGPQEPGAGAAASEVVRLRFDWPADLSATVMAGVLHTDGRALRYRFHLELEPGDGGLWVRHEAFHAEIPDRPGTFTALAEGSTGEQVLVGLEPDVFVDDAGALQRVDDAGVPTIVDETLERRGVAEPAEALRAQIIAAATRRQLQRAQEIWHALVELWADQEYALGSSYELAIGQGLENRPDLQEDWIGELRVSGWIPCPTRVADPRCVELLLRSRLADPDPARLAGRIAVTAQDLGLDGLAPEALRALRDQPVTELIRGYDERETIRLVCEPDGLIPHELDYRRQRHIETDLPGRGVERVERVRETSYRFAYED